MLGNPLLLGDDGYQISRSVRLRSSASAYFNRTPAGAGNRQIFTWSSWVKIGALSTAPSIFTAGASSTTTGFLTLYIETTNALGVVVRDGATTKTFLTTALYRDLSAWYHVVIAVDTTQTTAANQIKLYVNGSLVSWGSSTALTVNLNTSVNDTVAQQIGVYRSSTGVFQNYFDGYLTEINFIDGQALTPSSFGETNPVTGVWQPKKYTGTYGTNGFYLNFSDNSNNTAATIGKDSSGNGNNWTPNNISVTAGVTYDSMLDVPTPWGDGGNGRGNYAVISPLSGDTTATVTNGNLTVAGGNASGNSRFGSIGVSSGKWYWEHTVTTAGSGGQISGITSDNNQTTGLTGVRGYYYNGNKYTDSTAAAYGASFTTGDVIGVALDLDGGTLTFYKNNVSQGTAFTGLSGTYYPLARGGNPATAAVINMNFGQRPFAYTPPSGFKALNTQNLPTPTILKGNQYFDVLTYTGNGTLGRTVSGSQFQPDFVWAKSRTGTGFNHLLMDSVRGASKALMSNQTQAELTDRGIATFNSNGFTLDSQTASRDEINTNTHAEIAWLWKEGATQGFDIVTYTGTGANATVGHGLGVAPSMIIVKNRNYAGSWRVYQSVLGNTQNLRLNLTNAAATDSSIWNNTSPTSSVFTVGNDADVNRNGDSLVAYLFAEVAGFSRFGSYTGNGSADGPFVFCGFRPRFVMIKRTDSTGVWTMIDTARDQYNLSQAMLGAQSSAAEVAAAEVDVLSNGFKYRGSSANVAYDHNVSGATYIFAAFAENPFKYSLAR